MPACPVGVDVVVWSLTHPVGVVRCMVAEPWLLAGLTLLALQVLAILIATGLYSRLIRWVERRAGIESEYDRLRREEPELVNDPGDNN